MMGKRFYSYILATFSLRFTSVFPVFSDHIFIYTACLNGNFGTLNLTIFKVLILLKLLV